MVNLVKFRLLRGIVLAGNLTEDSFKELVVVVYLVAVKKVKEVSEVLPEVNPEEMKDVKFQLETVVSHENLTRDSFEELVVVVYPLNMVVRAISKLAIV